MARPYDLLSFLKQESRWDEIINMYHELAKKQEFLDNLWTDIERDTDLGIDVGKDENCMRAGPLNMIDWSHAPLEDGTIKNIPEEEFQLPTHYGPSTDVPDCKKISSLTFSMFAYEHLNVSKILHLRLYFFISCALFLLVVGCSTYHDLLIVFVLL